MLEFAFRGAQRTPSNVEQADMGHGCTSMALLAIAAGLAHPQAMADCALDHAQFQDTGGRGFTLSFAPAVSGVPIAAARLSHKTRGRIFQFDVTQSNGFGTIFLVPIDEARTSHAVYFFDRDLRPAGPNQAAIMFVDGLGAADYYAHRNDVQRRGMLGDLMWKFSACMKSQNNRSNRSR